MSSMLWLNTNNKSKYWKKLEESVYEVVWRFGSYLYTSCNHLFSLSLSVYLFTFIFLSFLSAQGNRMRANKLNHKRSNTINFVLHIQFSNTASPSYQILMSVHCPFFSFLCTGWVNRLLGETNDIRSWFEIKDKTSPIKYKIKRRKAGERETKKNDFIRVLSGANDTPLV